MRKEQIEKYVKRINFKLYYKNFLNFRTDGFKLDPDSELIKISFKLKNKKSHSHPTHKLMVTKQKLKIILLCKCQ